MGARKATWYTITVETEVDGDWLPLERPCSEAHQWYTPSELAEQTAENYGLEDTNWPWRVRVFAGYNHHDELLAEARSQPLTSH